jgi:hypothetical protein
LPLLTLYAFSAFISADFFAINSLKTLAIPAFIL